MMSAGFERRIRIAHNVLSEVGVVRSPSWIARAVREFERRPHHPAMFLDFLATKVAISDRQRRSIENNFDYKQFIELLMMPGNYAGRDHRKRAARHQTGTSQ